MYTLCDVDKGHICGREGGRGLDGVLEILYL